MSTALSVVCLIALGLLGRCEESRSHAADPVKFPATLPKTAPLTISQPLDEVMVDGIDKYALRQLAASPTRRDKLWHRDYSSRAAYEKSVAEHRGRLATILGVVDPRQKKPIFEIMAPAGTRGVRGGVEKKYEIFQVRWRVLHGVTGEGLLVQPLGEIKARIIAIPDPEWTAEEFVGMYSGRNHDAPDRIVRQLVDRGCQIIVPTIIDRDDTHSGSPLVAYTNQPHREFIYRMAFEMGRHVIGYEIQKVLAAVDAFALLDSQGASNGGTNQPAKSTNARQLPVGVVGVGEGGLIALHSAALDPRINAAWVCGYFEQRENVWQEPIYRNVWSQLTEFGDAEIASLIVPRTLVIEACDAPEVAGPPAVRQGRRGGAAPGRIKTPDAKSVRAEFARARSYYELASDQISLHMPETPNGKSGVRDLQKVDRSGKPIHPRHPAGSGSALAAFFKGLGLPQTNRQAYIPQTEAIPPGAESLYDPKKRHERQFTEMREFTQNLLLLSPKVRKQFWSDISRKSIADWERTSEKYRQHIYNELFGRITDSYLPLNPRSRKVLDEKEYQGYEVVLDVYPDVIASGILLLPTDLKPGERRPVVVCQHGLEGTPMDTITRGPSGYPYYKAFAAELAKRGFITYAPQNPYRGKDRFRTLQRKSNPYKRSLFSYIIPQHERTLAWLSSLPMVDSKRIAFYGLSYGGKTAVRVPPMLTQYALSICSADYNDWIQKNTSDVDKFSYIFTGEYEIFEWNMGHTANYAELSYLMAPRPFMVERGHDDGVGEDEWVSFEFAKVRYHYVKLGIGGRAHIEYFDGPHTINGKDSYDFLHGHLNWPKPKSLPNSPARQSKSP